MRAEFQEMSLFRLSLIIESVQNNKCAEKLFEFAQTLLAKEDEPKSVSVLHKIVTACTSSPLRIQRSQKTLRALLDVMQNSEQVDLENTNVRIRVDMLVKLAEIAKLPMNETSRGSNRVIG